MWWLNPIELVFVAASAGACLGGFVALICSNMRMSRCHKIKCCCFECLRQNLSEDEYASEIANQQTIQHPAPPAPSSEQVV